MATVTPRTLSGFMELLPAPQQQMERMMEILRTNLRKGDVIESVNGVEVSMEEDMIQAFRNERLSNQVLLVIGRGRQAYYAPIRLQ